MRDTERRRFEMLARVRDFGAAHAASFPAASRGAELFALTNEIVAELATHATAQSSGFTAKAQATAGRATWRAALREDLEAIKRTARAMSFNTPGLDERFRLPRDNRNDQMLLTTARDFHAAAAPLKAEFVRHDLPADFLDDLQSDIDEFEAAVNGQNLGAGAHVAATQAIDAGIERGLDAVRQLDAIVRNKFRGDPATLAAWTSASHTERPPRREQTTPPAAA